MKIYPSLISGDILNIESMLQKLDAFCHGYHIDVMDDHFVPNLTWGPAFVKAIIEKTDLPIHLHLMVDQPNRWIKRIILRKYDFFIFHYEAVLKEDIKNIINEIKKIGCKVGIAINPKTPIENIFSFLVDLDHVLLMSVEPGFSGQVFMPEVLKKVPLLLQERSRQNTLFSIGMDGGVGGDTIVEVERAGVEHVGVASAIFSSSDYSMALKKLYSLVQ